MKHIYRCPFNKEIEDTKKPSYERCATCGWNPQEAMRRKLARHKDFVSDISSKDLILNDDYAKLSTQVSVLPAKAQANWISVENGMPPEHKSIFEVYYGTRHWKDDMFRQVSDNLLVTFEYNDGSRSVGVCRTHDGQWNFKSTSEAQIIAWAPLPDSYSGKSCNEK